MINRRSFTLQVAAAGAAGTFSAALPALAQSPVVDLPARRPNHWDWFKHGDAIHQKWNIIETDNPNRVEITSKRAVESFAPRKRMLLVYPRPSSAYDVAITKILNIFDDKLLDIDITAVNFQNNTERGMAVIKTAREGRHDIIMTMGSEATAFFFDHFQGASTPVVTVCSKDPVVLGQSPGYNRGSGKNFAFTSLNMPIEVQMAYVAELKPRLRNIAVLVDSRNVSAIETQAKPVVDYARSRNIRALELTVQDPANARNELDKMVREATAQMVRNDPDLSNSIFWVTGSTAVFREIATINAHAGRAAVMSVVPDIVRGGDDSAVLSIGISFESNAHLAAVYVVDILRGRSKVAELPVGVVTPPDIAISFRKLRDIGMTVPLSFFEAASTIYDYEGRAVRVDGVNITQVRS